MPKEVFSVANRCVKEPYMGKEYLQYCNIERNKVYTRIQIIFYLAWNSLEAVNTHNLSRNFLKDYTFNLQTLP